MNNAIYTLYPNQGWGKLKSKSKRTSQRSQDEIEFGFRCQNCGAYVYTMPVLSGVKNRNHCPYCLWSRHVDYLQPGDRMSACKAAMEPIALTVKHRHNKYASSKGELMVIHQCKACRKLSINRIAGDDMVDILMEIFRTSLRIDNLQRSEIETAGIQLLRTDDALLVSHQLQGKT